MSVCPKCGTNFNSAFCPNCGAPSTVQNYSATVTQSPYAAPKKPIKNSGLSIAALVLSILGCTMLIGLILAIVDLTGAKNHPESKHGLSKGALGVCIAWFLLGIANSIIFGVSSDKVDEQTTSTTNESENEIINETEAIIETVTDEVEKEVEQEAKEKYSVGGTWQNKSLVVNYTGCGEYTEYNQYNAPADGNKIIYATFEFENIGTSDISTSYTDFHGYADGYEVNQSYAPDGTGMDFLVKMSAGRKGTGIVAFEVPEDASEIEIEFSPNFWTSENIVFVYSE